MKKEVMEAVAKLDHAKVEYTLFNNDTGINAKDMEGVKQTFYPTTGTIVLHATDDKNDHRTKTFRDKNIDAFIKGLKTRNLVGLYFGNEK